MKKIILCLVAALCVPAWAVNTLTENFDGPSMGFTVLASGSQGSNTVGTFDGSGHYVITQDSYIYRWVNTGDFSMQTIFNSINMGTPPEPNASNYRVFNYLVNHTGDNAEYFVVFFHKNAVGTQFAVDAKIGTAAAGRQYTEILPSLTSATLQVTWNEATKTYVISAGFNGGAISQKVSLTMANASNLNRTEYFYGVSMPLATSQPSVSLDKYTMTAGQTPMGQIDSFNDLTNWQGLGTQGSLDTTVFHEGTGSMKITYGSGLGWDVAPYKNQTYNFNYASPAMFTFWEKSALTGKERLNQLILTDTGNHVARFTCTLPANTNWNKVSCPLSGFVIDGGATFDWANVRTIQIWFTSWDTMGSAVWIDDLQIQAVPNSPKPPFQISSMDNISVDWVDLRGTGIMLQDTATIQEGTGSMKIAYTTDNSTIWDVVPSKSFAPAIDFNNYEKQSLSIWVWQDLVGATRLNQFIIYDDTGHTGRFTVPAATAVGWRKVLMPCKDFAWEESSTGNPVTVSAVNWHAITKIDLWVSDYPTPGDAIYFDDLEASNYAPPQPSLAYVMNAQKVSSSLTIDGNPADWAGLTDSDWLDFDLAAVPVQPNGNLHCKYKLAWDNDYMYVLVQELPGATEAFEAYSFDELNNGVGGDVLFDSVALYFDFTNNGLPPVAASNINLWLILGFSSTNRTDLMMAWTNGNWGPADPVALANAHVATSGTLGSRVIEAKIKWSDLAGDIQSTRLPVGGLLASIKPGYVMGCDPRLDQLQGSWDSSSTTRGAAFLNGNLWTNLPSGKDVYSTDIKLVCKAADLTGDCKVNFADFAQFAAQWLAVNCTDVNGYCNQADIVMDNAVNGMDLKKMAEEWLQ